LSLDSRATAQYPPGEGSVNANYLPAQGSGKSKRSKKIKKRKSLVEGLISLGSKASKAVGGLKKRHRHHTKKQDVQNDPYFAFMTAIPEDGGPPGDTILWTDDEYQQYAGGEGRETDDYNQDEGMESPQRQRPPPSPQHEHHRPLTMQDVEDQAPYGEDSFIGDSYGSYSSYGGSAEGGEGGEMQPEGIGKWDA
jgi:hypothetical protein